MTEQVICSAVLCDDGHIVRGHRHNDCFRTIVEMGKLRMREKFAQGFMTSENRYVDRGEALEIQIAAGIKSIRPNGYQTELYSEDLY
jgi:hypothetical protein